MRQPDAPRRYLSCSTLNGRLYLSYVTARDGGTELSYWTYEGAHKVFEPERGDSLVHCVADLDPAIDLSRSACSVQIGT